LETFNKYFILQPIIIGYWKLKNHWNGW
jgi:hypothetical protein